ncbi:hypothetical protein C0Q70_12120 [Pomacea canaliculata]|uniref:Uncharacterized protein n=2 Tax=Pomacea canaliculata TaxID=400727 RepID=A0A2T7P0M8_POMCA|nr:hypothetical protein C0Q70_12120 [Pomacea canaliculata]
MEIIFPFLYKIRRPSCEDGSHAIPHPLPSPYDHGESLEGLKSLVDIGVTLRTFNKDDWLFIASFLNVHYVYEGTARQREDMLLKDDLELLMNPPSPKGPMATGARGPNVRLRQPLMVNPDVFTMDAVKYKL